MRIVKIINSFYPHIGGGEKQAERVAAELVKRGHTVTVLTRLKPGLRTVELRNGVRVVRVEGSSRWSYARSMLTWIARERHNIDLLHAYQTATPLVVGSIARALWRLRIVCTPMTYAPELFWIDGRSGLIRRVLFKHTDVWMAKSHEILSVLKSYAGESRVVYIPNGVDTELFKPARSGPPKDRPIVLYVGRLEDPKRVDLLLKAWSRKSYPGYLCIAGTGSHSARLMKLASRMKLSDVRFLGPQDDVPGLLAQADVFVLPSDAEGMPNALLEAMSSGLACIGSRVGAIPSLLNNGVGLCVDNTVDDWIQAIDKLLSNRRLRERCGHLARTRILEGYDLKSVVSIIESVYERVLD